MFVKFTGNAKMTARNFLISNGTSLNLGKKKLIMFQVALEGLTDR